MSTTSPLNQDRLNEFLGRFVGDLGAAMHAPLVVIGDKLGLYRGLAEGGPQTPAQLASRTSTSERYVREWLAANAASGYVDYDAALAVFSLNEIQAFTLADETSPAYLPGAFQVAMSIARDEAKVTMAFKNGSGVGWHEHDHSLFEGTERFFRPNYAGHLVGKWLPALEGVVPKLERGARIADVGCGHGASTVLMAQAFPKSSFVGFDYHRESIDIARRRAQDAGVVDRVRFEVSAAKNYAGKNYDLVTFFDCLHDMGDPAGASRHVRESLSADGTWMIVEPFAHDRLEDNLNPVGRVFFSASTAICCPASLAQEIGTAMGAQAGEARLREMVTRAGFSRFRRATETAFNLVLEARL